MSYDISSEWDEDVFKKEQIEEEAGESVPREERESVWSSMNRGISYANLNYNDIA